MEDLMKSVETLIKKAATTCDSQDAMRFSQAAVNVTNAIQGMQHARITGETK